MSQQANAPDAVKAFQSLVDEYLAGYPTTGQHMLTPENLRFTAGKILLRSQKAGSRASSTASSSANSEDDLRFAACLLILYVHEHLMCRRPTILGTDVSEIYTLMQDLFRPDDLDTVETLEQRAMRQADFMRVVESCDVVGSTTEMLRHAGGIDALWTGASDDVDARGAVDDGQSALDDLVDLVDANSCQLEVPVHVSHASGSSAAPRRPQGVLRTAAARLLQPRTPSGSDDSFNHGGDDLMSTRPRQWIVSRRFRDRDLEVRYQIYFFLSFGRWLHRACCLIAVVLAVLAVLAMLPFSPFWKTTLASMTPAVAWPMLLCPLALSTMLAVVGSIPRLYNPRTYLAYLSFMALGITFCYALPVLSLIHI